VIGLIDAHKHIFLEGELLSQQKNKSIRITKQYLGKTHILWQGFSLVRHYRNSISWSCPAPFTSRCMRIGKVAARSPVKILRVTREEYLGEKR
jgi:hypothetical protein